MNILSYVIGWLRGKKEGTKHVELEGDGYTFSDTLSNGNIVIEEAND